MKLNNTVQRITFLFPSCVVLLSYTLIVNHVTGSRTNHTLPPTFIENMIIQAKEQMRQFIVNKSKTSLILFSPCPLSCDSWWCQLVRTVPLPLCYSCILQAGMLN